MAKYAQPNRFYNDLQLQVYMYAFMNVDTETIPVEEYSPAKKCLLRNKRKYQMQDQYQKIGWYLFTYVQKIMS